MYVTYWYCDETIDRYVVFLRTTALLPHVVSPQRGCFGRSSLCLYCGVWFDNLVCESTPTAAFLVNKHGGSQGAASA